MNISDGFGDIPDSEEKEWTAFFDPANLRCIDGVVEIWACRTGGFVGWAPIDKVRILDWK
jgi:hypothetical protein